MAKWKVGDVVQLKSGGPDMTVEKVDGNRCTVAYFYGGEAQRQVFDEEMLQSPPPPMGFTVA